MDKDTKNLANIGAKPPPQNKKGISQNDFTWYGRDISRPRQMIDIQHGITIMGGREVSLPGF